MVKCENECVECAAPAYPCIESTCPYKNSKQYYCDNCGERAIYSIDDNDLCEKCANGFIQEILESMSVKEKAELLDLPFDKI